jgi:hypothetical protein
VLLPVRRGGFKWFSLIYMLKHGLTSFSLIKLAHLLLGILGMLATIATIASMIKNGLNLRAVSNR